MITIMRTGRLAVLIALCAVLCLSAPAMAAAWGVNPDGTGDFTTVQAALDSEWTSGDTIEIAYAVYQEPVFVDAEGRDLTITGFPSPAGDLPVIDGMEWMECMDDATELSGFANVMNGNGDGDGCRVCSMCLLDGNFIVSNLLVTNATMHGLLVCSDTDGQTVQITGVEAAENERHGIYIIGYDEAVLTEITATDNGRDGIKTEYTNTEGTDLCCLRNAHEGLKIKDADTAELAFVEAAGNGRRGITVCLNGSSTAIVSDILTTDNGRDGLFVKGKSSEFSTADISRVESTGNRYAGIFLNGFDTFTARELLLDGNGVEQEIPPKILTDCRNAAIENEEGCFGMCSLDADCSTATMVSPLSRSLRKEGNGLFVVECGDGLIDNVEATNNAAVGILVDVTGDVSISDSTASDNGYLGILTMSVYDEYPLCADLLSNMCVDTDADEMTDALETFFTGMIAVVANATFVSEDEFRLGDGVFVFVENITEDGPDVILASIEANDNGYAGMGILAPYVMATDISTDRNGLSPTDVGGTLAGAGIVGVSFVGEYSDIVATDNGGAGMAAASLVIGIEDATFTGNGDGAASDIHGPLSQTGLLTISIVNEFLGVHSDQNAGSGILITSVMTGCYECSASGNEYGGIVAVDPLSLGIAALIAHSDLSIILETANISEEDRFYLESLSTPAMQDVMTCYGETVPSASSAATVIDIDSITEEDVAVLVEMLHQYMALSGCYMMDSAADENGLFGMAVVYPNVVAYGFSADGNGNDSGSPLEALLGTGIFGLYLTGDFYDTSVSENTGAGMVTVGVVSEYDEVIANNNGYVGIVTIDPVTLAAAALGAYFVVVDDSGVPVTLAMADTHDTTDLEMHADISESVVVQDIVTTYYTGTASADAAMDAGIAGISIPDGGMEILLDHIEIYFENAGVYATDVSASGNGYPGFVAIGPNVVMDGVTADDNGAAMDDESQIIGLAAGSGVIGLSIVGNYTDIAASGNTGAGIATAGVVTEMTACEADENGVGVVSLFIAGNYTEIMADENALSGIVLGGINGTLTDSVAIENAGPGIVCVDPVAAALMYLVATPVVSADDAESVSPETMALLCQLSGNTATEFFVSDESETAWSLIEWAVMHLSSYEGDITDLNETEIIDLLLTHYLTGAEMSVSDVVADDNGWQGVVVLSPSIVVEDVYAEGNGYHGVSVISPWKAADAAGWVHPAEPVGDERLSVRGIYAVSNGGAGLAVAGANGGEVMDVYGSDNIVGILLGDSDQLLVSDTTFETNVLASVVCGGNEFNSLIPTGQLLSDGKIPDLTGSNDNVFVYTDVDAGIVVLPNSFRNVFADSFFDETAEIAADISGDGPFILYGTSGSWAPVLPDPQWRAHMAGCGIGVSSLGGFNTTVNITYDYSYGYPVDTGKGLYPQWAVNATTPWKSWGFNVVTNDPVTMTVGTMQVPINPSADVPYGEVTDLMFIAPFWTEERSDDDPGHDAFMESLAENKGGYIGPDGVFIPYAPGEAPVEAPTGAPEEGTGDDTGDDTGDSSGDDTGTTQQSDAGGNTPAAAEVTATATAATSTPIPTTTPAGVAPVIGALGILGALVVIQRR